MGIFRRKKSLNINEIKQKRKHEDLNLEEKHLLWNDRWQRDDFDPPWNLREFPDWIERIVDNGQIPPGANILDIGCGSGYLSAELCRKGFNLTGFDFSEEAIKRAIENFGQIEGRLDFYTADATKELPFEGQFEAAIDRGTFHTIPPENYEDYAKFISRRIKSGGVLFIMYADRIARNLPGEAESNSADKLKSHILDHFSEKLDLIDFRVQELKTWEGENEKAYLIELRKL
jgi:SAM-dependent methyltransferase